MDAAQLEETLRVFEASLSEIRWRLKPSSKRRLETDILALCTGMRPVIMVDYGGKLPELKDHLCAFLKQCKKESLIFELLRVMIIDDMIYLIQVKTLTDFVASSLNSRIEMLFVDLEKDPPKMVTMSKESPALMQLLSAQKFFAATFHADCSDHLPGLGTHSASSSSDGHVTVESSEVLNLSSCLQKTQVSIPALNGWLLGYPVVYLFGTDYIERAIYNLSTKSLHIYQIFVGRVGIPHKENLQEELMSFTVPYELSSEGRNEQWAKSFLVRTHEKWEKCRQVWGSLHMEVSGCYPQAIAL